MPSLFYLIVSNSRLHHLMNHVISFISQHGIGSGLILLWLRYYFTFGCIKIKTHQLCKYSHSNIQLLQHNVLLGSPRPPLKKWDDLFMPISICCHVSFFFVFLSVTIICCPYWHHPFLQPLLKTHQNHDLSSIHHELKEYHQNIIGTFIHTKKVYFIIKMLS